MNRYPTKFIAAFVLIFLHAAAICRAQNISGVINSYYKVTAINAGTSTLTLTSTAGLTPNAKVIIIQMKGATIDVTNTASFGNITPASNINNAGNYEVNTICSVVGNDVVLRYALVRSYTTSGLVQLVTLPRYTDAIVTATLTPAPWDPVTGTGGVLALESTTLTLNASIDASGAGFRGADFIDHPAPYTCNFATNVTDYAISNPPPGAPGTLHGGRKGEGIAIGNASYELGRGKLASGGGGGNNHGTGGAGGGNYGAGGGGGIRSNVSGFGCQGQNPGIGGLALQTYGYSIANNRVFLGGGGGGGNGNNNVEMGGGHGGGIVIIFTGQLTGNNNLIAANGARPFRAGLADPYSAGGDGGGGGGAGGVVILNTNNFTNAVQVQATGARGSDANNAPSSDCNGPGGGGAGGAIWVQGASVNPLLTTSVTGGSNGLVSMTTSLVACRGQANNATPGANGAVLVNYPAPIASTLLCVPLPLNELIYFKAKENHSSIELDWKMTDVRQIAKFALERSTDQNNFSSIATIGTTYERNYQFSDIDVPSGFVYYRLKTFYKDGRTAYSNVIAASRTVSQRFQLLRVSPNPANDRVFLLFQTEHQFELAIEVHNSIGQSMILQKKLIQKGTHQVELNLSTLRPGSYFIRVAYGDQTEIRRILKSD